MATSNPRIQLALFSGKIKSHKLTILSNDSGHNIWELKVQAGITALIQDYTQKILEILISESSINEVGSITKSLAL
jgi:hypothetical protein